MISTNVPRGEVDRFVDLALKAKQPEDRDRLASSRR